MFSSIDDMELSSPSHLVGWSFLLTKLHLFSGIGFPFLRVPPLHLLEGEQVSCASWGPIGLRAGLGFGGVVSLSHG